MHEGQKLKEEVLAKLKADNRTWMGRALFHLRRLPEGEYTGEDIRYALIPKVGHPKNSHVWGSLTLDAIRKGYITKTGKIGQMMTPSSHAHNTPIYKLEAFNG